MKVVYLLSLIAFFIVVIPTCSQFGGLGPVTCDIQAAAICEDIYLQCSLFSGPADDPNTLCQCGESLYGDCLRKAGCMLHMETIRSPHQLYQRECVNFIMKYNCPDTSMCGWNCATAGYYNKSEVRIIPFNNYGPYYLRIRVCTYKVHPQKLQRYGIVYSVACQNLSDFQICNRWIPSNAFFLVAFSPNTTYVVVDYCQINADGTSFCFTENPSPSTFYGNDLLFPSTFDVAITSSSVCRTDGTLGAQ